MYIYHALINALSTHMINVNLNTIFYTQVEHSPTKTIYIRYYMEIHRHTRTRTHTHTHTHTRVHTHTHTKTHTHASTSLGCTVKVQWSLSAIIKAVQFQCLLLNVNRIINDAFTQNLWCTCRKLIKCSDTLKIPDAFTQNLDRSFSTQAEN